MVSEVNGAAGSLRTSASHSAIDCRFFRPSMASAVFPTLSLRCKASPWSQWTRRLLSSTDIVGWGATLPAIPKRSLYLFDYGAGGMVIADTLENFRQANRRIASIVACRESVESPDAESKRSIAAAILSA